MVNNFRRIFGLEFFNDTVRVTVLEEYGYSENSVLRI
jgi:hypothetical protein